MMKKGLIICGLLFFIAGVGLGLYLVSSTFKASALDRALQQTTGGSVPICTGVQVNSPRVITMDDTAAVTVTITNHEAHSCEAPLSLQTLDFDTSSQNNDASIVVSSGQTQMTGWLLKPRSPGTYTIEVVAGSYARFLGITVTTIFGLSAWQAQLLSYVGTFLGPLTGFAWWYDRWKERKQKKRDTVSVTKAMVASQSGKRMRRKK